MMRICLSYSHTDGPFAAELSQVLRAAGHEVTRDVELLTAGQQDWWKTLDAGLRQSDVFVALLSETSVNSQFVLNEVGAARAYAAAAGDRLVIPVLLDGVSIPQSMSDIWALIAPIRDPSDVGRRIDQTVSAFAAKRAAKQEERRQLGERITTGASDYIGEAMTSLSRRESRDRRLGLFWQSLGFAALVLGVAFALLTITQAGAGKDTWAEFAHLSLRGILIIALLGACSKYAFTLGKSYTSEALKSADRVHAINFGRFYLRVFGSDIEWSEIKEAFAHWNIDRTSVFAGLNAAEFDPKIIESIVELMKAVAGRTLEKK
jgi:hypothetical protein